MLVCGVALRPNRGAIAATILERANAADAPSISAVFAILADDNASARDTLDGFVGKIMVEAASAAAVVDAGAIRNGSIVEQTNAGASPGATVIDSSGAIAAPMAEAATADSVQDAATVGAFLVANVDGTFVKATMASTVLGTDVIDSGPIAPFE